MASENLCEKLREYRIKSVQLFSDKSRVKRGELFVPVGSPISFNELLALKNDIKPAVRIDIPFDGKTHLMIKSICDENNFFMSHSDHKFISNSNLDVSSPIPLNSSKGGLVFYYISKNEKMARELKRCDRGVNFERFSSLLGYPDCCIEFAKKLRPGNPENHVQDAIKYDCWLWSTNHIRSFRNSKEFSFYLNKYSVTSLISHTPCHMNCRESKTYAKKLLSCVRNEDTDLAQFMEYLLKLPSLFWNYTDKIVFHGSKNGNIINYYDFFPSLKSHVKFSSFPDHDFSKNLMKIKSEISRGDTVENSKEFIRILKNDQMIAEFEKGYEFECILAEPNKY